MRYNNPTKGGEGAPGVLELPRFLLVSIFGVGKYEFTEG